MTRELLNSASWHRLTGIRHIFVLGNEGGPVSFGTRADARQWEKRCRSFWARPATPAERAAFRVEQGNSRFHAMTFRQWAAHRAWESKKNRHTAARLVAAYAGDGIDWPKVTTASVEADCFGRYDVSWLQQWSIGGNVGDAVNFIRDCVTDDLCEVINECWQEEEDFQFADNQSWIADGHGRDDLDEARKRNWLRLEEAERRLKEL